MYALCNENSLTLWSHWQTFIILFIKLVCDIRQIDVNWKYSPGVLAWLCHFAWEKLCMWCIPNYKGETSFPFTVPQKHKWAYDNLFFFFPVFLLVLLYANSPVAHSLQADLSLIFCRGWNWILLLLVQPVHAMRAAQFYHDWTVYSVCDVIQILSALCTVAHATGTSKPVVWCLTLYILKINVSFI